MKCRDCRYMQESGDSGLFRCANQNCPSFNEFTGLCSEDECNDGESWWDEFDDDDDWDDETDFY